MASTREQARKIAGQAMEYQGMTDSLDPAIIAGHLRALYALVGRLADAVADSMDEPLLTVKGVTVRESDVERTIRVCRYDKLVAGVANIIGEHHGGGWEDVKRTADRILKSLTERDLSDLEDRLHDEHEEN